MKHEQSATPMNKNLLKTNSENLNSFIYTQTQFDFI